MSSTAARAADEAQERLLRALEIRRTRALVDRDLAMVEALHAPDYELVTPAGRVLRRSDYLEAIAQGPFYLAWDVGEMACRLCGDLAILRYQAVLRFPSGRRVTCWHTDVYEKRLDQWQAVWSQATEISLP